MQGKTFKYILLLAMISIAGVFLVQFAFLKSAFNYSDEQFRESTSVALKEVCYQLLLEAGQQANYENLSPVEILSGNTYLVNVDQVINAESLKSLLKEELRKHEVYIDFEYAQFDPSTGSMEEGIRISGNEEKKTSFVFPGKQEYINYFVVHFPDRSSFFSSQLSIWYFLTALLVLIISFFIYTLLVILKQRRLSEAQKNFINNLTHELKTPISAIALSAGVINNKNILNAPDRLLEYAKIIEEQNKRHSTNVEKVLNLAALEKNRIKLNLHKTDPNVVLQQAVEEFRQTSPGHKARIKQIPATGLVRIQADKFHLTQLVINILENGVKYNENPPVLTIETKKESDTLVIHFYDNGIGIAKDQRNKIFKRFYRIPTGDVHDVKGFGLGLDYVKKITKAHKWKIRVDENPSGGSIFTLRIPLLLDDQGE